MIRCIFCGSDIPEGNFCDICGANLKEINQGFENNNLLKETCLNTNIQMTKSISNSVVKNSSEYNIIKKIGSGGGGNVYLVQNDCGYFAMKEFNNISFPKRVMNDIIKRLEKIKTFNHKNIVRILEYFFDDNKIRVIMEYIDGKNLSDIIDEKGKIELRELSNIIIQICEGIEYSHQNGIIHRDIKPSNIIISKDGIVKITDFDIACELRDTITSITNTQPIGTPLYMAPEQHLGKALYSSDIYSLGVLIYESLTGKIPFKGSYNDIIYQKEKMSFLSLKDLLDDVPSNIDDLVKRCLNYDPSLRPSFKEIKDELSNI